MRRFGGHDGVTEGLAAWLESWQELDRETEEMLEPTCTSSMFFLRDGDDLEHRVAREAREQEVEKYWPLLVEMWPAYESFFADTHERAIFVLRRR